MHLSDTPKPRTPDGAMYSDATLTILSNKNNPVLNVTFQMYIQYHFLHYNIQMTNQTLNI